MNTLVVIVLLCAAQVMANAQIEDLADQPWAVPQWDALERYREDPLCLPCLSASELTVLPGFNRTTAGRVLRAAAAGLPTLERIADSACLSIDQAVILYSCTTLDCSCEPFIESARLLQRLNVEPGSPPDMTSRLDVSGPHGRIGGVMRTNAEGTARHGWAQYTSELLQVNIGNAAIAAGAGLVHGSAGGFGRSPMARAIDVRSELRLRPWTSTWTDGALKGVAGRVTIPVAQTEISAIGASSEGTIHGAVQISRERWTIGSALSMNSNQRLSSIYAHVGLGTWELSGEAALDEFRRLSSATIVRHGLARGQVVLGARWSHPDVDNTSVLFAGISWRQLRGWHLEASLDLHSIMSRSYGRPLPSRGMDLCVDVQRSFADGITIDARVRYEIDDEGWRPTGASRMQMFTRHRTTTRIVFVRRASRDVQFRLRADVRHMWSDEDRPQEWGYVCSADVVWTPLRQLRLTASLFTANAPSIESAAYSVIVPVPGAMTTIVGVGTGSWFVVGGRWTVVSWSTISLSVVERTSATHGKQRSVYAQIEFRLPR